MDRTGPEQGALLTSVDPVGEPTKGAVGEALPAWPATQGQFWEGRCRQDPAHL